MRAWVIKLWNGNYCKNCEDDYGGPLNEAKLLPNKKAAMNARSSTISSYGEAIIDIEVSEVTNGNPI